MSQTGRRVRLLRPVLRFLATVAGRRGRPVSIAVRSAAVLPVRRLLLSLGLQLFVALVLLGLEELMVFGTIGGIRTVLQLFLDQGLVVIAQIVVVQLDLLGRGNRSARLREQYRLGWFEWRCLGVDENGCWSIVRSEICCGRAMLLVGIA